MGEEPEPAETGTPEPERPGRKWIALAILAALVGLSWKTIDPGKIRWVVVIILGAFALRIALTASSAR